MKEEFKKLYAELKLNYCEIEKNLLSLYEFKGETAKKISLDILEIYKQNQSFFDKVIKSYKAMNLFERLSFKDEGDSIYKLIQIIKKSSKKIVKK